MHDEDIVSGATFFTEAGLALRSQAVLLRHADMLASSTIAKSSAKTGVTVIPQ